MMVICVIAVCITIIFVMATVRRISDQKTAASARAAYMAAMAAKDRQQEQAVRDATAMTYYSLQATLGVIQGQARDQAEITAATVRTLSQAVDKMAGAGETVEALEAIQARAIVGAYTRYLTDQQAQQYDPARPSSGRYWEEVADYD